MSLLWHSKLILRQHVPAFHMDADSWPGWSTSDPAPCLWESNGGCFESLDPFTHMRDREKASDS